MGSSEGSGFTVGSVLPPILEPSHRNVAATARAARHCLPISLQTILSVKHKSSLSAFSAASPLDHCPASRRCANAPASWSVRTAAQKQTRGNQQTSEISSPPLSDGVLTSSRTPASPEISKDDVPFEEDVGSGSGSAGSDLVEEAGASGEGDSAGISSENNALVMDGAAVIADERDAETPTKTADDGERPLSEDEIGKALNAFRKERMTAGLGNPASTTDFWGGVLEETKLVEWPSFKKVLETTGVVVAIIFGSSIVLLTVNAILAELSDNIFNNPEIAKAWLKGF